ncbi:MAG TPA: type II secretion system protein G [Thermoanaerobaculia bacterium]
MLARKPFALALVSIALLLAVSGCKDPARERKQQRGREVALKDNLFHIRKAIDNFHADKKRYPASLEELVPNYLRMIPPDPITGVADWRLITEETVAVTHDFTTAEAPKPVVSVLDVKSKAPGAGADGKPYSEY